MQISIVTNPHLEQKDARPFVESLMNERRRLYGFVDENAKLDLEGLNQFKKQLGEQSKMIAVK